LDNPSPVVSRQARTGVHVIMPVERPPLPTEEQASLARGMLAYREERRKWCQRSSRPLGRNRRQADLAPASMLQPMT
jgi:hypothetical protein